MAKRQLNRRQNWRIEKIQGERAARAANASSTCCRSWKVATWGLSSLAW